MGELVRTSYGKNLFLVMKMFNVLPSEQRWKDLDDDQLSFLLHSVIEERQEAERHSRGVELDGEAVYDEDFEWESEDFNPLRDDDSEEDIYSQLQELMSDEDKKSQNIRLGNATAENERVESGELTQRDEEVLEARRVAHENADDLARRATKTGQTLDEMKIGDSEGNPEYSNQIDNDDMQDIISNFNAQNADDDDEFGEV